MTPLFSNSGLLVVCVLVFFIAFFSAEMLKVNADNPLITYSQEFCHLEKYYGFDCMTVQFWKVERVPCGFHYERMYWACADWRSNTIIIASWAKNKISSEDGLPILMHEIKHLKCRCNFH